MKFETLQKIKATTPSLGRVLANMADSIQHLSVLIERNSRFLIRDESVNLLTDEYAHRKYDLQHMFSKFPFKKLLTKTLTTSKYCLNTV